VVVDVDSEPDSYVVVVVDSYPPSIAVLVPEVFVCVVSPHELGPPKKAKRHIKIINVPVK